MVSGEDPTGGRLTRAIILAASRQDLEDLGVNGGALTIEQAHGHIFGLIQPFIMKGPT